MALFLKAFFSFCSHETFVTFRLMKSNFSATILFFMNAVFAHILYEDICLQLLLESAISGFIYGYVFDIMQQALSAEEDRYNKPDRPIPAGLLTVAEVRFRWLFGWVLSPVLVIYLFGYQAAFWLLMWQLCCAFFYVWPKFGHWVFRHLFVLIGTIFLLRWTDVIAVRYYPDSGMLFGYDLLLCFWITFTIHIQEFHDVVGDERSGRQTLVLLFGESRQRLLRVLTAVTLSFLSGFMVLAGLIGCTCSWQNSAILFGVIHCFFSLVVSSRLCLVRSHSADVVTYKVCYLLSAGFLWIYFGSHSFFCSSFPCSFETPVKPNY